MNKFGLIVPLRPLRQIGTGQLGQEGRDRLARLGEVMADLGVIDRTAVAAE